MCGCAAERGRIDVGERVVGTGKEGRIEMGEEHRGGRWVARKAERDGAEEVENRIDPIFQSRPTVFEFQSSASGRRPNA